MADTPDYAALAREYLDLWEDQLAAMTADPTLAEQSARFFGALSGAEPAANPLAAAQMATMAQQFMTLAGLAAGGRADHDGATDDRTAGAAAGAAAAGAASGNGDQQLAELASRLAALEERLDRLEAGGGGTRRGTKSGTGKRGGAKGKAAAKRTAAKRKS